MESTTRKPKIIFRLSHMGDVALITGVLTHWHEAHSDTFVVVTREGNTPVLENHPAVERVIGLKNSDLKTLAWIIKSRAIAREYANHTLVDLHSTLRSRILSFFWKGDIKSYPKFSFERRMYDRTHKESYRSILESTNVPQRYAMALDETPSLQKDLTPRIYLTDEEQTKAATMLSEIKDGPLVALHPYATHASKEWPRAHWTKLIDQLNDAGMKWIIIGRNDKPIVGDQGQDFTNRTDLRETCGLLKQADLLITGDSGPMHLAGGVQTPVLALFGPTVKSWGFYPAGPKDRVLELDLDCRPCSLHGGKDCEKQVECLAGITPDEVMRNIREVLPR